MHLNRLGVAFCEEGKLEKRIVNDKRTFPDLREHRPVDLVHVENCRALAACVDLDEANVGAMRIEARPVCMPSLLKTSFGSRPSRSWSRVSFLIAISALRRRHYGPAHKIPDSSRGLTPTFSLAGFVPAGNSDIQGGPSSDTAYKRARE